MFFKKLFKSNNKPNSNANGDKLVKEAIDEYQNNKNEFEVIKKFQKALEIGIENYSLDKVYLYIGLAYKDLDEYEKAIEALEKGCIINPSNSKITTNLGSVYTKIGKPEKAYKLYYDALKLHPENAVLYNNIGIYYYNLGHHIKALEYFEIALKFNSTLIVTYANKARSLAYIGNYEEANKFAKISKLRDYDDYNQLVTDIQDIKISNPKIYFDRLKYIEFVIQISNNDTELLNTIFNIIDKPTDFYKQNEGDLEAKLYTSFEIKNGLHVLYLIDYLTNLNKIVIFDNSEDKNSIVKRIEILIKNSYYIEDNFFDEIFENKEEYTMIDLLTLIASKLKVMKICEMLDIWSNEYNFNIVLMDLDKWEKLKYPYTNDVYGIGVIRDFATEDAISDFISKEM